MKRAAELYREGYASHIISKGMEWLPEAQVMIQQAASDDSFCKLYCWCESDQATVVLSEYWNRLVWLMAKR